MTYDIKVTPQAKTCIVDVVVCDDSQNVIQEGSIELGTTDENVARYYAENIFLFDLRLNYSDIATLVLPIDTPAEEIPVSG